MRCRLGHCHYSNQYWWCVFLRATYMLQEWIRKTYCNNFVFPISQRNHQRSIRSPAPALIERRWLTIWTSPAIPARTCSKSWRNIARILPTRRSWNLCLPPAPKARLCSTNGLLKRIETLYIFWRIYRVWNRPWIICANCCLDCSAVTTLYLLRRRYAANHDYFRLKFLKNGSHN